MPAFDPSNLLPLYLDETDELITALNEALLTLEQSPDDAKALQEAFRHAHTIKGSSALLGFEPVKELTHQLESIFDLMRGKKRTLDPAGLELFFRCLDGLRDFHHDLRRGGSGIPLDALTSDVVAYLHGPTTAPPTPASVQPKKPDPPTDLSMAPQPPPATEVPSATLAPPVSLTPNLQSFRLRVTFEANLQLSDIKARLILNRLSSKTRVLASEPPAERFEEIGDIRELIVTVSGDASIAELRTLADVGGVVAIEIPWENAATTEPPTASSVVSDTRRTEAIDSPAPAATATVPGDESAPSQPARVSETVRVDIDRLDSLMNLAGELVINKARFLQLTSGLDELFRASGARLLAADTQDRLDGLDRALHFLPQALKNGENGSADRFRAQFQSLRENFRAIRDELDLIQRGRERLSALSEAINQLARVSDGIQKGVLNTRMVPIGPLFGRFRRVIRDLSVSSGKEITLHVNGEKTELDKRMIDELGDPLVHMVRNSVDHGLESPEERERLGKPRAGTISLGAAHRGNSVVITVSDDGSGIDVERIRKKIVQSELVHKEEASRYTDRELISFIWHPGLSTAERVTDLSGRGVGMDIVKSRIESLNGSIDVRTVPGQGTTFSVRLPLTLAILPSLLVRIYSETYAVPLDHVDEIVEAPPAVVHNVHEQRTLEIRKKILGLISLGDIFRWGNQPHPDAVRSDSHTKLRVIVVQNGESAIGLVVDQLIGIQEVVLKSLEKNFRPIPGLSGASILGDGNVSLILDVDALIAMAERRALRREADPAETRV